MRTILNLVVSLLLLSLYNGCMFNNAQPNNDKMKIQSKDEQQISNAFIINVEAIRKELISPDNSSSGELDYENVFLPYAVRYNLKEQKYQASPFPTSKQISVRVDTVVYSTDSLLCVALLDIENHYSDVSPFEKIRDGKVFYDGKAIIGHRDSISDPFQIFPINIFSVMGYDNRDAVHNLMRRYYFFDIVGKSTPAGTNIEGDIYKYGIGSPEFFVEAPNFKRNKYDDYKFKYYLYRGKEVPYNYLGNNQIASHSLKQ